MTARPLRGPVLITGGAGLLGSALARSASDAGSVVLTTRNRPGPVGIAAHVVDLAEPGEFAALVSTVHPALVIHTAYGREDLERDVVSATREVVTACMTQDIALIHMSSDVIFDGEHGPYDELAAPSPVSAYGEAKAAGERLVAASASASAPSAAIVRTSLLVRADPPDPASAWVIESNRRGEPVTLFSDEYRCPVSVDDVAAGVWRIADLDDTARSGVWHLVGPERLSRVEMGELLARRFDLDRSLLLEAPSASMPGPRPRDVELSGMRAHASIAWAPRHLAAVLAR